MASPKVISRKSTDLDSEYKYGFVTEVESEFIPKGLDEENRSPHLGQEGRA